jgi:hypothetical protein
MAWHPLLLRFIAARRAEAQAKAGDGEEEGSKTAGSRRRSDATLARPGRF